MAGKSVSKYSRPFLISMAVAVIWAAAGAAVLQFTADGDLWGVLFATVAVVLLAIVLEGGVLRRLEGKPIPRANVILLVGVLAVIGLNELWGLFIVSTTLTGSRLLLQLIFTVGFVVLIVVTLRNSLRMLRSG
jgi:hypothetical protein